MAAQAAMFSVVTAYRRKGQTFVSATTSGTAYIPTKNLLKINDAVCYLDPAYNIQSEVVYLEKGVQKKIYSQASVSTIYTAAIT